MPVVDDRWDLTRKWIPRGKSHEPTMDFPWLIGSQTYPSTLAELADRRLLVLLGEPGSGKSVELQREGARLEQDPESRGKVIYLDGHKSIHDLEVLRRRWFDSSKWKTWLDSDTLLWVIFDGYDESASKISSLAGFIEDELKDIKNLASTPIQRLFLWIGSRSTGWQGSLDEELRGLFLQESGEPQKAGAASDDSEEVQPRDISHAFQLVPLDRRDVQSVATSEGLDGEDFWHQLEQRNIQALAMRPAQLRWLINTFRRDGTLPSNKAELYWEGIRQHAMPGDQPEEGDVYRAIAARIAFVSTFGGYRSIWTSHDRGDVEVGALVLTSLAGEREKTEASAVDVDWDLLRQTIDSGLFTRINDQQVVWAHQTFPEFLAARYCARLDLPIVQIIGLITNPHDVNGKVIPGMSEVAAWLASMSCEVREYLFEHDPSTLVESDVAMDSPESRELLLKAYLKAVHEQRALPGWRMGRGKHQKLYFDGMEQVIADVISDTSRAWRTRDVAIDIALDCELSTLGPQLAALAIDSGEDEALRRNAAYAVERIGAGSARQMLKPLLDLTSDGDPYDEFRGHTLAANWPEFLSIDEVLGHLGPPRWEGYGAYRAFLYQFPHSLQPYQVFSALSWFGNQPSWRHDPYEWERLEEALMDKAVHNLAEPGVFDWFVSRVADNLAVYKGLLGGSFARPREEMKPLDEPKTRQDLLARIARSTHDMSRIENIAHSLVQEYRVRTDWMDADFSWMVEQLRRSSENVLEKNFWLALVLRFAHRSHQAMGLAYELYLDPRFKEEFAWMFRSIKIDSEEAENEKRSFRSYLIEDREYDITEDVDKIIQGYLDQIETGQMTRWWQIDYRLHFDEHRLPRQVTRGGTIPTLKGWGLCSHMTQQRVFRSALPFLEAYEPHVEYIGTDSWRWDDEAAYWALVWMAEEGQEEFAQLSGEAWRRLGPLILSASLSTRHESGDKRRELLETAMEQGFNPIPWLQAIAKRAQNGESYYLESGLNLSVAILSTKGDISGINALADEMVRRDVPFEIAFCAIRVLFEHGYEPTFKLALKLATDLAAHQDRQSQVVRLITTMMSYLRPGQWEAVRSLAMSQEVLFEQVALSFGYRDHDHQFMSSLTESEIKQLFEDILLRFPRFDDIVVWGGHSVSPRESLGQWRDGLLRHLSQRGTWEAVSQLRMLSDASPSDEWLRRLVFEAEDSARLATLESPSVADLMSLVRRPDQRLVTSAEQLQAVVLESLARLQEELQGPTPGAESWWNYPRSPERAAPKEEQECSNAIKLHFERDLEAHMVLANREVKSRPKNVVDLLIEVMAPNDSGGSDRISVVCEVKGCWNSDLMTSQESQLLNQYMQQEGYSHGVYIVAFFDGDRWEGKDRRARHARNRHHSFESLSRDLSQQAKALSVDGKSVKSFVLNLNYESGR